MILPSARRHGVGDAAIRHALAHPVDFHTDDDLTMVIGPDPEGQLLEVGVVEADDALVVIHAMPARPKYLR